MVVSWLDMIAEGYRNSEDEDYRKMFEYYEKELKPRIEKLDEEKNDGNGFYYEAYIDLWDYYLPEHYEELQGFDFDKAAELCFEYLKEQDKTY